jgi:hypothetical protein
VLGVGAQSLGVAFTPTDSANYSSATKSVPITVNKAPLEITANSAARVYGATNSAFTVVYAGFVNGDTASVVTGSPGFTTLATSGSNVGTYPITPTAGTLFSNNYSFTAFNNGTLTVTRAPLTATAENKTKPQGIANPALTVSYAGFVNRDSAASLTIQPTATTTAVTSSPMGTYPITLAGGFSSNYSITYIAGTLTVTAAGTPYFTIQPAKQTVIAGSTVTLSAAASGTPTPTYQWQKNGVNIAGATSNTYSIFAAAIDDTGNYTVVGTNSVGSVGSDAALLVVMSPPSNAVITFTVQ